MNRTLRIAAALFTLAGASSIFAQSLGLAGDTVYRRHMLRDPSAAAPAALLPGPNAQHLIYLGLDSREAIERAGAQGELPLTATSPAALPGVSGYDLYARNAMAMAASQAARHSKVAGSLGR